MKKKQSYMFETTIQNIVNDIWFIKDYNILSQSGLYLSKTSIPKYQSINKYISWYISRHDHYDNLRAAVKQECPEFEGTIDKLAILK